MGFSLIGAFAILGVSLLIALELFTGNILPTVSNFNDSFRDMKDRSIEQLQTDFLISNVLTQANNSNYDLNITVKNNGSVTLKTSDFNILINGSINVFACSNSYLYPENTVYFNVYNLPGEGKRRLKVVSGNGISDYEGYTIST